MDIPWFVSILRRKAFIPLPLILLLPFVKIEEFSILSLLRELFKKFNSWFHLNADFKCWFLSDASLYLHRWLSFLRKVFESFFPQMFNKPWISWHRSYLVIILLIYCWIWFVKILLKFAFMFMRDLICSFFFFCTSFISFWYQWCWPHRVNWKVSFCFQFSGSVCRIIISSSLNVWLLSPVNLSCSRILFVGRFLSNTF